MTWFLVFAVVGTLVAADGEGHTWDKAGAFATFGECRAAALAADDSRGHFCVSFPTSAPFAKGAPVDIWSIR